MTLYDLLSILSEEESPVVGLAHAGTINIETGFAEVSSGYFGACSKCASQRSTVRVCKRCGRSLGNNVNFLAGRGDGVYSGLSFANAEEQILATIFVFDESIDFAVACGSEVERLRENVSLKGNEFQSLFHKACQEYWGLEPFTAGTVLAKFESADDPGFIIADMSQDSETTFATVDVPWANGEFSVILFMEPLEASSSVQTALALGASVEDYTRGVSNAMRPRVAAIIRQDYLDQLIPDSSEVDWEIQTNVWHESPIASNLAGSNAGHANYTNGTFWGLACRDAQAIESESWYLYSTRSFGFFIEGALSGHELCTGYMVDQIELGKDQGILDFEVLSDALNPRGRVVDDALVRRINDIWNTYEEPGTETGAKFCSECGTSFDRESAKFCPSCGTPR